MTLEIISYAKSGLPIQNGSLININYGRTNKSYSSNSSVTSDLDIIAINAKYQYRFNGEIEYYVLGSSNNYSSLPSPSPTPTNTATPPGTPVSTPTITPTTTQTGTPASTPTPTQTGTPASTPTPTPSLPSLITTNSANFNNCAGNVSTVGSNGRSSYYGSYDMSGNIWEWTDTRIGSLNRVLRGGNLAYSEAYMSSIFQTYVDMNLRSQYVGFRIGSYSLSSIYNNVVIVSDIDNTVDNNGFGNVSYSYYMGRYEITNSEYVEFLNAVAQTDTYELYLNDMNSSGLGGISRAGESGNYVYTVKENKNNKPVNFVNWFSCARYCNWLHNGKPTGPGAESSTENGSYTMVETNITRNNNALFFMLSENEWYKGAYYKGGSTNAGYWLYATQSDTTPNCVQLTLTGDGIPS